MSSSFLPLNAKQDVRPGTRNPGIFDSTLISSSVMPSLKYSSFLSALMFTNGNTAIDLAPVVAVIVDLVERINWKARRPAAITATPIMSAANFFLLHWGMTSSGETFSVRLIPSGVISNAHAITSATGKPTKASTTTAVVRPSGRCNAGTTVAVTCISNQPTTAYAT